MIAVVQFIIENKLIFISLLLAISEALSLAPRIKANGVFQAIVNGLKSLKEKFAQKAS